MRIQMGGQVAIVKLSARNHAKITKNVKLFGRFKNVPVLQYMYHNYSMPQ